jgi:4-hydroxythreonine-4-phosphate dehydrogenase
MEQNKIKIGITQGDVNGIGYEVILKTFEDPTILELCTPIVYGSPKVMTYHRKALELETSFSIINSTSEAVHGRLNVVNCCNDEVKVELGKPSQESGKAAFDALERAMEEYKNGLYDVLVTAPIHKQMIQSDSFTFPGHTEYIEQSVGDGAKALMILANETLRVALVTGHVPVAKLSSLLTQELIQEKLALFNTSLKQDFGIGAPRIAVLALNPHAGDGGVIGTEEETIITPAIKAMREEGVI